MTEPLPTGPQTCSECAHWTLSTEKRAPEKFGDCRQLTEYHGYSLGGPPNGQWDPPLDQVVVESDEGWGIFTGPNFSCLHFAAKHD